jgi:hypothetical protein
MPVETATYISELNTSLPAHTDGLNQADAHDRLIKSALKATFPNFTAAALSATQAQIDAAIAAVAGGTVAIVYKAGTAALPGIAALGDPNTGIYSPGADQLGFAVNGVVSATIAADKSWTFAAGITVNGAVAATGNVSVGGTLGVTGNTTLSGTLGVTGAVSFSAALTGVAATFTGILTASSTSHMVLPTGTTAQRPGAPTAGLFRYNSTLGLPEFGDGASWRQPSLAQPIAGGFRTLKIEHNAATPNTKIDVSADAVTVETTAGIAYRLTSIAHTIDAAVTGANGLDAGGLAISQWYAVWEIYNPTTDTKAGLLSLSGTAPTMPAGYTAKSRLGWRRTDASAHFIPARQLGRYVAYRTPQQVATTGVDVGSTTVPTWVAVSVVAFVPSTASQITVQLVSTMTTKRALAPNNSYGTIANLSNRPPLYGDGDDGGNKSPAIATLPLDSTDIYWVVNSSAGDTTILCHGWEDNL